MGRFTVTIHSKSQMLTKVVNKESFTVGRALDCDIPINENLVSRVHLIVSHQRDQIFIEDKNSSNGTFLNGAKLEANSPAKVTSADKIQLGKSEYILFIHLEEEPPAPEPVKAEEAEPDEPPHEATIAMPTPTLAPVQAEKILHEAKLKAAQIILEGETQAEKKVQAIYQKARDVQAQADIYYQTHIADANKEADAILADFQRQGRVLLQEARTKAQELRDEIDITVQNLKQKARVEIDQMVAEATAKAEKIKADAFETGKLSGQQQVEDLRKSAQEEAKKLVEDAKAQVQDIQSRIQFDVEKLKELDASVAKVNEQLSEAKGTLSTVQTQEQEFRQKLDAEEVQHQTLLKDNEELRGLQRRLEDDVKRLQEAHAHLSMSTQDFENKKNQALKEYEIERNALQEKLDRERTKAKKLEEERLEELRLETTKQFQKMEQDLLGDLVQNKALIVKEILTQVERLVVTSMEPAHWRSIVPQVERQVHEAIESRVGTMVQSSSTPDKSVQSIKKKRTNEKMQWAVGGLMAGALIFFGAQQVMRKINADKNPLQTRATEEALQRQIDLEQRRFNPAQVDELKDNYTDAVIYTRNFVNSYLDSEYQKKFFQATAKYMLKTWRIEEDRSLAVVAASSALVKELADRKEKIHPDFIKDGVAKMHALESQSLTRMKDLLGSEVRLESYRRFERDFYQQEIQSRVRVPTAVDPANNAQQ